MPRRKVVFVSYYTPNYRDWATNLRTSLSKHGLEYDIVPIDHKNDETKDTGKERWQANVRYKPFFLLEMLQKHKDADAIVWVDADGVVERVPALFFKMREDLGVNFIPHPRRNPRKFEMLSGTVYLANNKRTLEMMRLWTKAMPYVKEQRAKRKWTPLLKPEQQVLQALLTVWKCIPEKLYNNSDSLPQILKSSQRCKVKVLDIPEAYCHIKGSGGCGQGVIVHQQASREWRWPEKARRKKQMLGLQGKNARFVRKRKAPKPPKPNDKKRRGLPVSRRRRRRRLAT